MSAKTKTITVRISDKELEMLLTISSSVSKAIRELIKTHLQEQNREHRSGK